jgi:hypothetical protein
MNKLVNLAQIVIYANTREFFVNRDRTEGIHNLLLFEYIGIGDLLCALDSIDKLNSYYLSKGECLWIAIPKSLESIIKTIRPQWNTSLIIVDFNHRNRYSYDSFKSNVQSLLIHFWNDIIIYSSWGKYYNLLCKAITYNRVYYPIWGGVTQISKKNIAVGIPKTAMRFTMYSLIISSIMGRYTKCGVSQIGLDIDNPIKDEYCVISMCIENGHAYPYRAWSHNNFIEVIQWILDNTSWKIVLTGIKYNEDIKNTINNTFRYNYRIINKMGKTNLEEWIAIIRDAICIISNDTGDVHMAAALNTKSFVIAGYWDYGRFLPYDECMECNTIPTPIYGEEPHCKWCRLDGLLRKDKESMLAKRNCDAMVREKSIYACLDEVTPEMVVKEIKLWMD